MCKPPTPACLTLLRWQKTQEVDLLPLAKDVASAYVETLGKPQQVRHVIDRAVRVAIGHRTVTCVIVPHDVQRHVEARRAEQPSAAGGVAN